MSRTGKTIAWVCGGSVALLLLGVIVARFVLLHYVESDAFRAMVGRNIGRTLKADAEVSAMHYANGTLSTTAFTARGYEKSAFAQMEIEPIRADIRFGKVLEGVWQIERVEAEQATLNFSGPRLPEPEHAVSASRASEKPSQGNGWLPNRVEVNAISLQRAQVRWDGGRVRDVAVEGVREGDEWALRGDGGALEATGWPAVTVDSFRLRQRGQHLTIERAELHQGATGVATITGEVRFDESVDLTAKIDRIPIEPILTPDWKKRLTGNLNGTIHVTTPLPADAAPEITGSVTLTDGRLVALPVLDELAVFTQLAQFRTLTLSRIEGDFRHHGDRLEVSKLIAESAGLCRVEGGFVVENGLIKGDFQVGLTPTSIQWLPGARTKLFATTRDGYCWAPMHLEGPVGSPREDLSQRLVTAVAEGAVDTVREFGKDLPVKVPDAAKKMLDLFLGK